MSDIPPKPPQEDKVYSVSDALRSELMQQLRNGIACLLYHDGYRINTKLQVKAQNDSIWVYWRTPKQFPALGAELFFVSDIVLKRHPSFTRLTLSFPKLDIELDFMSKSIPELSSKSISSPSKTQVLTTIVNVQALRQVLVDVKRQASMEERQALQSSSSVLDSRSDTDFLLVLRKATLDTTLQEELMRRSLDYYKRAEAISIVSNRLRTTCTSLICQAMEQWKHVIRHMNNEDMNEDKRRWRLHAISNMDNDLQAWYHCVFSREVYRLRGSFWYRDAILPSYRKSYTLVDNVMSAKEEQALSNVLCSPDTTYSDVAGQVMWYNAMPFVQVISNPFNTLFLLLYLAFVPPFYHVNSIRCSLYKLLFHHLNFFNYLKDYAHKVKW